jgi:hypothetical protein
LWWLQSTSLLGYSITNEGASNPTLARELPQLQFFPIETIATYTNKLLRGRARIFHFWASAYGGEIPANTLLGYLIARFRWDGGLDEAGLACATRNNFPWMNDDVRLKRLARQRPLHPRDCDGRTGNRTPDPSQIFPLRRPPLRRSRRKAPL